MCCSKRMAAAASSCPPRGQAGQAFWPSIRFRPGGSPFSSTLAEAVEGDDFGSCAFVFRRAFRLRRSLWSGETADGFRLRHNRSTELQNEIYRRIGKGAGRRKRDCQPLQLLLEAEGHRERLFADLEVPELVLQDDRHLFRKALAQAVRDADAGHPRREGDIEMVRAPASFLRDPRPRLAHA